jgi:hypothetical protein
MRRAPSTKVGEKEKRLLSTSESWLNHDHDTERDHAVDRKNADELKDQSPFHLGQHNPCGCWGHPFEI